MWHNQKWYNQNQEVAKIMNVYESRRTINLILDMNNKLYKLNTMNNVNYTLEPPGYVLNSDQHLHQQTKCQANENSPIHPNSHLLHHLITPFSSLYPKAVLPSQTPIPLSLNDPQLAGFSAEVWHLRFHRW